MGSVTDDPLGETDCKTAQSLFFTFVNPKVCVSANEIKNNNKKPM